jgi:hypothetical protein
MPLIFVTLGPDGTNHDLVTRRYLTFHGLHSASVALAFDFDAALALMAAGEADHMIQCAVHPALGRIVAEAHFRHGISIIDTFISPSHPLAIIARQDVSVPSTLALHAATRDYVDLSEWPELIDAPATAEVATGLLEGRYEAGICALSLAREHPERFRVLQDLGTVDDAWVVFGGERTSDGGLLAWRESPAGRLYRD